MDNWPEEEWRKWAADALASGSVWLLEKGEKVVVREPTSEQREAFRLFVTELQEKFGRKQDG